MLNLPKRGCRRLLRDLAAERVAEAQLWPDIDDELLAKFLADPASCSDEERERVNQARQHPDIAEMFEVLREPLPEPVPPEPPKPPPSGPLGDWPKALAGVLLAWLVHWVLLRSHSDPTLAMLDSWNQLRNGALAGVVGFLVALPLLGLLLKYLGWIRRRRVFNSLAVGVSLLGALTLLVYAEFRKRETTQKLNAMFLQRKWVTYEPPGYDPDPETGRMPTEEEMERDLALLHSSAEDGGRFDGVITFSAQGTLGKIPEIAKRVGFRSVIMGIYIPKDKTGKPIKPEDQFQTAKEAQDYVDGFCLGQNPSNQLDIATLAQWVTELRQMTDDKPVTTTAPLRHYIGDRGKELRQIGDFYFPDVVGPWWRGASPQTVLEELERSLLLVSDLPRDKPCLLKMISYPSKGRPGIDEEAQAEFFRGMTQSLRPPSGAYLSIFNSFDLPWKNKAKFDPTEEHVGLYTKDRIPKRALKIVREDFPVQTNP